MSGPNPIADRQLHSAPEVRHASPLERCAGLVFGYLFHGGAGTRVNDDTLSHHLGHDHDWTWLHLALADHRARRFLESFGEMPGSARDLMLAPEDRVIESAPDDIVDGDKVNVKEESNPATAPSSLNGPRASNKG